MRFPIELIYADGCPNVTEARRNLRAVLESLGMPLEWHEWEQTDPGAPGHAKHYGSPTILVKGYDVTGGAPGTVPAAPACRADGAPAAAVILAALLGAV